MYLVGVSFNQLNFMMIENWSTEWFHQQIELQFAAHFIIHPFQNWFN